MKGEAGLQVSCLQWFQLQYPKLAELMFHVPNGGSRNAIEAVNLKKQGVKRGVADLLFLFPRGGYGCLCIEMKYGKNGQSDGQKRFQQLVEAAGNKYVVCRTVEEFIKEVNTYLGKK